MEQNLQVMCKRVWSIVKAVVFMMRKGVSSKKKLMVDLNMVFKRGKIASVKAIVNLLFHHHKDHSSTSSTAVHTVVDEYEFSCSKTPNYIFPFNLATKKKKNSNNDQDMAAVNAVKVVLEMLNNNDNTSSVAASPVLPGFGQTQLARQLSDVDEHDSYVDKAAEDFINRFYKDLWQQNKRLSEL